MRIVIVGGGFAAASAAATLRERGFDGPLVVAGEEPHLPYDRPPLSKAFLRGEDPDLTFKPDAFWTDNAVEMRTGVRVARIDLDARTVDAGGEPLPWDRLLLATGGTPRRLPVPGADLPGLYLLRTIDAARAIRDAAAGARRAAVVGMGFIGAEVAASLRERGLDVVAVEPLATPLERVLGAEAGAAIERLHRDHGLRLMLGRGVASFEGDGRVEALTTSAGERVECDFAVAGVGIAPNVELAEQAGIACENGILVDASCRTSADGVYAAGDAAAHDHPLFGRIRVEHWQNAISQGAAAARAMLGDAEPYADVHWFWSDQYDASLQYAGHHAGPADLVVRGRIDEPPFTVFYLQDGIVKAVFGFDTGRDVRRAMRLVGTRADPARLRDPGTDLRTV